VKRLLSVLVRVATYGAVAGAASGMALWRVFAAARLGDGRAGTAGSVLAMVLLLLPAGWLLNVRFTLASLRDLPETLIEVAERSRSVTPMGAVRSYGDLTGSWALVIQLASPVFWIASAVALVAVLVLTPAAMIATAIAS
jgi:hypothetical protein